MNNRNFLDRMADMVRDDNKGIIMTKDIAGTGRDSRGYIVSFGLDKKECYDSACVEELGLSGEYICMAFFVDRKELEKYK